MIGPAAGPPVPDPGAALLPPPAAEEDELDEQGNDDGFHLDHEQPPPPLPANLPPAPAAAEEDELGDQGNDDPFNQEDEQPPPPLPANLPPLPAAEEDEFGGQDNNDPFNQDDEQPDELDEEIEEDEGGGDQGEGGAVPPNATNDDNNNACMIMERQAVGEGSMPARKFRIHEGGDSRSSNRNGGLILQRSDGGQGSSFSGLDSPNMPSGLNNQFRAHDMQQMGRDIGKEGRDNASRRRRHASNRSDSVPGIGLDTSSTILSLTKTFDDQLSKIQSELDSIRQTISMLQGNPNNLERIIELESEVSELILTRVNIEMLADKAIKSLSDIRKTATDLQPKLFELRKERIAIEERMVEQRAESAEGGLVLDIPGREEGTGQSSAADDYGLTHQQSIASTAEFVKAMSKVPSIIVERILPDLSNGKTLDLGGKEVTILRQLGSGTNAKVFLCSVLSDDGQSEECALKVQSTGESLVLEYRYLSLLLLRIEPDESGFLPFPRLMGHYMFNGGDSMLLMNYEPGCLTALQAVNYALNNTKLIDGTTRAVLATYFTARLLTHTVKLHKNRILVSVQVISELHLSTILTIFYFSIAM